MIIHIEYSILNIFRRHLSLLRNIFRIARANIILKSITFSKNVNNLQKKIQFQKKGEKSSGIHFNLDPK